ISAPARGALLEGLLEQEGFAALRTLLLNRLVPVDRFAFRVVRTAVKDFTAARFLHHQIAATAGTRALDPRRLLLDVFTFRVIRARDEFAVTAPALDQLRVIDGAFLIEQLRRRS